MKCPRCGLWVSDQVGACRGCSFSIRELDRVFKEPPPHEGPLHDDAGILTASERADLEGHLRALAARTGGELVVVTEPGVGPRSPSERAFWLYNRWQVGGPEHRGLLVLLAPHERRVECEVGVGWEEVLDERRTEELLDDAVLPHFREGRWLDGLKAAVDAAVLALEAGPPAEVGPAHEAGEVPA